MKIQIVLLAVVTAVFVGCQKQENLGDRSPDSAPAFMVGRFMDDYDIEYTITDNTWVMDPDIKFSILQWNTAEQYLLAQNHPDNVSDAGLFARIDYMRLEENMTPYVWGFCISSFDAESKAEAEKVMIADRGNPKSGCNGHPFSRMKPIKETE